MRKQLKFSEFGKILQEKELKPGETSEVFKLEIPKNHIGFVYYLASNYSPLKVDIDGEKMDIKEIIASIGSPKLYDPPFLVKEFIKVTATSKENKKISVYIDGVAYSVLNASEEALLSEIKGSMATKLEKPVITEEKRPQHPHIINHKLTTADQWYEIKLPAKGVKTWSLRCREENNITYSFEPSHSTYMTLSGGETLSEDTAPQGTHAIYVASPVANVTIELELWREE